MNILNFFNLFKNNKRIIYFENYSKKFNYEFTETITAMPVNIPFDLFSKGKVTKISCVVKGLLDGCNFLLCDFEKINLTPGGTKIHKKQSILIIDLKKKLNNFILKPIYTLTDEEREHSKNVINNSEFSASYYLKGDENYLQRLFSDEVLYFFRHLKYISAEVYEDKLLFYVDNLLLELHEGFIGFFMSNGVRFAKLLNNVDVISKNDSI